jgi:hypothetical protein
MSELAAEMVSETSDAKEAVGPIASRTGYAGGKGCADRADRERSAVAGRQHREVQNLTTWLRRVNKICGWR